MCSRSQARERRYVRPTCHCKHHAPLPAQLVRPQRLWQGPSGQEGCSSVLKHVALLQGLAVGQQDLPPLLPVAARQVEKLPQQALQQPYSVGIEYRCYCLRPLRGGSHSCWRAGSYSEF